jgi:hypothetical protein
VLSNDPRELSGVTRFELAEEFTPGQVEMIFQMERQFWPNGRERIDARSPSARRLRTAVGALADHDAARSSLDSPTFDLPFNAARLAEHKSARMLGP